MIVCQVGEQTVLLESFFDTALDEYSANYSVYFLSRPVNDESFADWSTLTAEASARIGAIPVTAIEFDATNREWLDSAPLLRLIEQSQRGV